MALAVTGAARAETILTKGSNESVTSSTVVQNDDDLFFATSSGVLYDITLHLAYSNAAGNTPDISYDLGEDGTVRGHCAADAIIGGGTNNDTRIVTTAQSLNSLDTAATPRAARIECSHLGGGGTFRLRWAQFVSNGTASVLHAGSTLRYRPADEAGGGGGGSTAWGDITGKPTFNADWLTDVDTTGAIDGTVLKYNEATSTWEVATDDAGGEGSSGPVTLSAGDRERLDLNWWGVWAIVGLLLVLMIAPQLMSVMRVTRGMADGRG